MKHLLKTVVKTLIVLSIMFISVIAQFIVLITMNCNQMIETSPFIIKNGLHNEDEVYQFVSKMLRISHDKIDTVEQFINNNSLSCYGITSYNRIISSQDENYIDANEVITCIIPAHESSFLGDSKGIWGLFEVCFFNPRLRINFFFKQRTLVEIRTDIITSGL